MIPNLPEVFAEWFRYLEQPIPETLDQIVVRMAALDNGPEYNHQEADLLLLLALRQLSAQADPAIQAACETLETLFFALYKWYS